MSRNILIGAAGIALSFVLMNAGRWISLHYTTYGAIQRENPNRTWQEAEYMRFHDDEMRQKYGASYNELFWKAFWLDKAVINPIIVLIVGVLVGSIARGRGWILAALSITPFAVGYSIWEPNAYFLGISLLLCIGYLFVAIASALVARRLLHGALLTKG